MSKSPAYRAFISYAHKDNVWASWLHRRLENYRIPQRIVGEHQLDSNRLIPIFRDRDELSASSDLSTTIQKALAASEHLIVVCSPNAAASHWVNEEIRYFKALGRSEKILYLLVDDPDKSFPEAALRNASIDENSTVKRLEPVAADARDEGDGKSAALQKLVAGLLDVRLDEIVRREAARRNQRLTAILAASLAGLVGTSGLALYAYQQRAQALEQKQQASQARDAALQAQAQSEEVVDFLVEMFEVSDPRQGMGRNISARDLLDEGAKKMDREFVSQPLVKARLMHTMGRVYMSLGTHDQAITFLEQSLQLRRGSLGQSHPQVAQSLTAMVPALILQEDLPEAEAAAQQALAMNEELLGTMHPEVADSLMALAEVFTQKGQYAKSEKVMRRALAIRQATLGDDHLDTANVVYALSSIALFLGNHQQAETLGLSALKTQRNLYGNSPHLDIAESLNNLGTIAMRRGQYDLAEEHFQAYVDMLKTLMPDNHPKIALALENLGSPFYMRRNYGQASALLEQALEIRRVAFGKDHQIVGRTLVNLATVLTTADALDEADRRFKEALPVLKAYWGGDHPDLPNVLTSMGLLADKRGQKQEAFALLSESVSVAVQHFGDEHPESAVHKSRFARVLVNNQRIAEAEPLLHEAKTVFENVYGKAHTEWVQADELLTKIAETDETNETNAKGLASERQ
ncbi:MAG: tetratricopeptide repeat protein [Lysobacterales bacterium]